MKSLQQYIYENNFHKSEISEKLIINKDYKKELYNQIPPPSQIGDCLMVGVPKKNNGKDTRIFITTIEYEVNHNNDNVIYAYNRKIFIKGANGYYQCEYNHWIYILLFGEDAIAFLTTLLNSENNLMNISDICDKYNRKGNELMCLKRIDYNKIAPYEEEEIKKMIDELS